MKNFSSSLAVAALALQSTFLGGNAGEDKHVSGPRSPKRDAVKDCLDLSNDGSKCSLSIADGHNLDLSQCRISGTELQGLEKCFHKFIDNNNATHEVNLLGNRLENVLSAGFFARFSGLEYLDLGDSRIRTLPYGVFDGLDSLKKLDFNINSMKKLTVGTFDSLITLKHLNFRRNKLTTLPLGVFDSLTSLRVLDFRRNKLKTMPAAVFDSLTNLTVLDFERNKLEELHVEIFHSLTSLEKLDLGLNNLAALPDGVFDHLTSLHTLHLSLNDLSELPAGIFHNLTSLEHLFLHCNGITKLPAAIFDSLTSLKTLSLSENDLHELPAGIFSSLKSLKKLWVDDNPDLLCLPTVPSSVTQLKVDDHVGVCVDVLPCFNPKSDKYSCELINGEINLSNCGLTNDHGHELLIRECFKTASSNKLDKIISVDMGKNNFKTLPEGMFHGLTKLNNLFLGHNGLETMPKRIFQNLNHLGMLSLHDNYLETLPHEIFDSLEKLTELDLSTNYLPTVSDGIFRSLTSLKKLLLNDNDGLSILPAWSFDSLEALEILWVNDNPDLLCLPTVPSTVTVLKVDDHVGRHCACFDPTCHDYRCDLKHGHKIDLSSCGLTDGHGDLLKACFDTATEGHLGMIKHLSLRNNHLVSPPTELLEGMQNLEKLNLEHNCDLKCIPATDEHCDPRVLLTEHCNRDMRDTICDGCLPEFTQDGFCDTENNNASCGFDGGDCCEETCEDGPNHICNEVIDGAGGFNCLNPAVAGSDMDCRTKIRTCLADPVCAPCATNADPDGTCDNAHWTCSELGDHFCCVVGDSCRDNTLLVDFLGCVTREQGCQLGDDICDIEDAYEHEDQTCNAALEEHEGCPTGQISKVGVDSITCTGTCSPIDCCIEDGQDGLEEEEKATSAGFCAPDVPGILKTVGNGIDVCCNPGCTQCGGPRCGSTTPGLRSGDCCTSSIIRKGHECGVAPCILHGQDGPEEEEEAPSDDGFCAPGIPGIFGTTVKGVELCCHPGCKQCGGPGCGTATPGLGSSACCHQRIARRGKECGVAPCILPGKHY